MLPYIYRESCLLFSAMCVAGGSLLIYIFSLCQQLVIPTRVSVYTHTLARASPIPRQIIAFHKMLIWNDQHSWFPKMHFCLHRLCSRACRTKWMHLGAFACAIAACIYCLYICFAGCVFSLSFFINIFLFNVESYWFAAVRLVVGFVFTRERARAVCGWLRRPHVIISVRGGGGCKVIEL